MGFKALTVNTAAEAAGHIYAEDDAAIFQSMFGGDGVLNIGNCLKSTVISNNKVRISDGVLSVGGHIGRLSHADYQDMTIENGATGYNRNDIIYARFLTSGNVDSFILAVKKGTATTGTASDPALVQGNLYEGAVERDYPLYRVKLSGLSIASVDQLFTVIPTIPDLKAQMAKDKAEINQSLGTVTSFDIKSGYSIRESSARRTLKICTINIRIRKDDGFGTGFVEMANIIGKDNYPAMPISFPCSIVTTDSGRCLGSGEVQINTDGKIKVRASDSTKNIAYSEASINANWVCA